MSEIRIEDESTGAVILQIERVTPEKREGTLSFGEPAKSHVVEFSRIKNK